MTEPCPLNQVRYVRHAALPAVELLIAEPSAGVWRMFHERYLICGCISVATTWFYRGKSHRVEDGATGFMEPGEIHRVVTKHKPSRFRALFIEPGAWLELADEAGVPGMPHFRAAHVRDPRLLEAVIRLAAALQAGNDNLRLQSQLMFVVQGALAHTERRPAETRPSKQALRLSLDRARDYLEAHSHERISLDELARACGLSRFHLVHSFSRRFGLAPHSYLIQGRIRRAAALLRSDVPCVEAAATVGFADQSHFTRCFKKIMGVTPARYASARAPDVPKNENDHGATG